MLAAVNLAATALHDGVGALTAGFGRTTFVHFVSVCSLYFRPRKYPFYIRLRMSSPPGDPSPDELGHELLRATYDEDDHRVLEVLNEGADVNYRGSVGETALMVAAHHLNLTIIRLLLEKRADKTITSSPDGDFDGKTALGVAQLFARLNPGNPDEAEIIRLLSGPVAPPGGEPEGGSKKEKKKTAGRRFTRKQCKKFTCKKMGFTQKASCRPYKNCYLQKKKQKKTTKNRR